jgi:hypothetical protein
MNPGGDRTETPALRGAGIPRLAPGDAAPVTPGGRAWFAGFSTRRQPPVALPAQGESAPVPERISTPADDGEIAGDVTPRGPDAAPYPGSALDPRIEPASTWVGADLDVPRIAPPPPVRILATPPSVRVEAPASTTASQDGLQLPVMGRDSRALVAPVRAGDSHTAPPPDDRPLPRLRATVHALQVEPGSSALVTGRSVSAGAEADGSGFIASAEPPASGISVPPRLMSQTSLPAAAPTGEPVLTVSPDSLHSTASRPSFQESGVIYDVVVAAGSPVSVMGSASAASPAPSLDSEVTTELSVLRDAQQRGDTSRRRPIRIGTVHVTVTPPPGAPAPERQRQSTLPPAAAPRSMPDFADPWLSADVVFE